MQKTLILWRISGFGWLHDQIRPLYTCIYFGGPMGNLARYAPPETKFCADFHTIQTVLNI